MKTGNLKTRTTKTSLKTYRMVALNTDVMLLYLTHSPASDMAALVRREDNPGLVDDALDTFDTLWEDGVDMKKMLTNLPELTGAQDSDQ
jgi:hypothetical protein